MNTQIDFGRLEEQFGTELFLKISKNIENCNKKNTDYRVEVISQDRYFTEIAFITYAYSYIYEIVNSEKTIFTENRVGAVTCNKVLKSMDYLNNKQKEAAS